MANYLHNPLAAATRRHGGRTPIERFNDNTDRNGPPHPILGTPCHVWTAGRDQKGYGKLTLCGREYRAHRVSYEFHIGPIEPELEIDHLCRNEPCINPEHLEEVTSKVNTHRSPIHNVSKTHCKKGHAFTESNTIRFKRGGRNCRICHKVSDQKCRAR